MKKRFKSKKNKNKNIFKILIILLVGYISFNLIYNLVYNLYLSKLSNDKIIEHIINNTKNSKISNKFFSKYQNPKLILDETFLLKDQEVKVLETGKEQNTEVEVYIYNTHDTEEYEDKYLEIYNIKPTVKTMSYILKDYLSDLGIKTIVEEKSTASVLKEHNWSYKHSYEASKEIIMPFIKENPKLKLIIDLHRDATPLSKSFVTINDINYAKILFVVGMEHENHNENYQLAEKLNEILEKEINSVSRGISKKSGLGVNGVYNQDLSTKSVLIELGGQYNEIEELNNTLKVLSKVILKYIEGEIWKTVKKHG